MTDDATPAAAQAGQGALRLTPEQERAIRRCCLAWSEQIGSGPGWTDLLLAELDATRAELQQARAENARLREAYIEKARNEGYSNHFWSCGGCRGDGEECADAAEAGGRARLARILAATTSPTMQVAGTQAMSETCGACGHERQVHLIDEWCSQCDCQWFGPQLNKHAPADHQAAGSRQP